MALPILSYGHNMLRQQCQDIGSDYPELEQLIGNMWETLYGANGCGLAAPQVNRPIRLFLVDSKTTYENLDPEDREEYFGPGDTGIIETFINARITYSSEDVAVDNEGCLSIPGLTEAVERPWTTIIEYYDRHFEKHKKTYHGATARMIQHEYDHIEGILYLDYLKPFKRKLLSNKLNKISKGLIKAKYPMKFVS